MAIACPDLHVTLVESRRPRAAFLELVLERLGLTNGAVSNVRVETLDGPVDLCFSRAFARVGVAWQAADRLLAPGGRLVYFAGERFDRLRTARRCGIDAGNDVCACKVGTARYHEPAVTTSGAKAAPRTTSSPLGAQRRLRHASARAGNAPRRTPVPPETPGVARIIAIANQKGGVGKSTTAVSLGASLADLGYRVLVIDLDPQGNASTGMGIRHEARETTVYHVIVAESPIDDAIVHTPVERLHAVPSTIDLAGAEIELVSQFSRETRLKKALDPIREGRYDFVLLDCPPSLGLLTVNALTAAEELIVPIQCEYYALEGLGQLLRNVSLVQQNINPDLRLSGIVMTMFDPRTKLSEPGRRGGPAVLRRPRV